MLSDQGIDPFSFSAQSIEAWATATLVVVAFVGFALTIWSLKLAQRRERIEVAAYIRVDLGPPEGTADFPAPKAKDITPYIPEAPVKVWKVGPRSKVIAVWFRNEQTHALGIALGVGAQIITEVTNRKGESQETKHRPQVSYIEPGESVKIDLVRFPPGCSARAVLRSIEYRSLYYDASDTKHGRWECVYENGQFKSIPWSDPPYLFSRDFIPDVRDLAITLGRRVKNLARSIWERLRYKKSRT